MLVPFAREVLRFFDRHYPRGPDGKLRLEPAQVLETWWIAVNPTPDIAGLRFSLRRIAGHERGDGGRSGRWRSLRGEIPGFRCGRSRAAGHRAGREMGKARQRRKRRMLRDLSLPLFRPRPGLGELVRWTMEHRTCKDVYGGGCWTQDQIHWAYAGNAAAAATGLAHRFRTASTMCRFPLYGPRPDSCPDFDHFGSGATALQHMLVQEAAGKILLLPAWPATWDVDFKLHVAGGAALSGRVKDGKLLAWDIRPSARKADVVVGQPQRGAAK